MKKIIVLVVAFISIIAFTACEKQDGLMVNMEQFRYLESNDFIVINGGRYFSHQLVKYIMYEDDEIIVYNLLPLIINEEYEMYLNSQKPIDTSPRDIQTYHHWSEYVDELKDVTNHIKISKKQ